VGLIAIHYSRDQKEVSMREKVEKAIDEIRPYLQADGGNIELIDVAEGIVKVKLVGACGSCPMSQLTLKRGVEARLKAQVPEVKEVIAV
jgi:Fe-S cluster biogenesis protein NfuA